MTNDQIIQASKDLGVIKGMENSPWVLGTHHFNGKNENIILPRNKHTSMYDYKGFIVKSHLPWLNNSSFDGKWSSAAIREGLGLGIDFSYHYEQWDVRSNKDNWSEFLDLTDPAADDLANLLGIIEYHKQFPQEVVDYLEGLKC